MTDEQIVQPDEVNEGSDSEPAAPEPTGAVELGKIRELVLAAHPDVVPEMVQGDTIDDLMASVEPAREAYQRIAGEAAERTGTPQPAPKVAAQPGQRGTTLVDVESLSPLGKISEGLKRV